jgi:hypothetical protein
VRSRRELPCAYGTLPSPQGGSVADVTPGFRCTRLPRDSRRVRLFL